MDAEADMKLSRFINEHIEEILAEWESFARTLRPAAIGMSAAELRDHGKQILQEIALDIETDENPEQQTEKSKGLVSGAVNDDSAAATHGSVRHDSGFTLIQLIAEYRAMRASVLRLWMPCITHVTQTTSHDMLRFNEAIDQALAESALTFSDRTARIRDTFLAILGHDLRSPLAAMVAAGDYLSMPEIGTDRTVRIGGRVKRSAATMTSMVNDLLEFARTQLCGQMPIAPHYADVNDICEAAIHDARAVHPDCPFELEASGDLTGSFDSVRLQQVVTNLLNNAAQFRAKEHPVKLFVQGEPATVILQVMNLGPVIPAESLEAIFNPMVQLSLTQRQDEQPSTSLGLGLFISREITEAHGGTITAESTESSGTVFTVRLPKTPPTQ